MNIYGIDLDDYVLTVSVGANTRSDAIAIVEIVMGYEAERIIRIQEKWRRYLVAASPAAVEIIETCGSGIFVPPLIYKEPIVEKLPVQFEHLKSNYVCLNVRQHYIDIALQSL